VMFIHRPDITKKDIESPEEKVNLIIEKQRNGPTGPIDLAFSRKYARFDNYEREFVKE
jgi:replicative DNA helicase